MPKGTRTPTEFRRAFKALHPPLTKRVEYATHGEKWEHPANGRCIILSTHGSEIGNKLMNRMIKELEEMGYPRKEILRALRLI